MTRLFIQITAIMWVATSWTLATPAAASHHPMIAWNQTDGHHSECMPLIVLEVTSDTGDVTQDGLGKLCEHPRRKRRDWSAINRRFATS